MNRTDRNSLFRFLLILLTATFLYLYNIGFSDLWSDEVYTNAMLDGSLSDFYTNLKNDLHPPLYYLALRAFTYLFGQTPLNLRLFSVLGVLSTVSLGFFVGQRIFGKQGALVFCLMLISIPMLAAYSHQARMYTWAAFFTTGVYLFSCLFLRTGKRSDFIFLFIFTVTAMYTHYYSMVAALSANVFVIIYLLVTKNKRWKGHLLMMTIAFLLYIPWTYMLFIQVNKVRSAFWAPNISMETVLSCFSVPFSEQLWTTAYSHILTAIIYGLTVLAVILSFRKSFSEYILFLWLSVAIFIGTILFVTAFSLTVRPILYSRYIMTIVTMLVVPVTVLLIRMNSKWLRSILMLTVILLSIRISVSNYSFSYGPYKQSIEYIASKYPDMHKILHLTEITAGPMEYYDSSSGLEHYWLKAKMSNVDAFKNIHQYEYPTEFLKPGEDFCIVRFNDLDLNNENFERVMSESELSVTDTVKDEKVENGNYIQIYFLKYKGVN